MRGRSREIASGLLATGVILFALLQSSGCARSGANLRVSMDLAPGAARRSEVILVTPAAADRTLFLGDFSDHPPSVLEARERMKTTFARKLVAALRASGLAANLTTEATAGTVVIELEVQSFDAGSAALRVISGSTSHMVTGIKVMKGGATVAQFSADAFSGWHSALIKRVDGHIDDTVTQLVKYLRRRVSP
jgi:hypothetical protein